MKLILRSMLLVSIGLMACFQGNAQTIINGGNVSGLWTKKNSPYQVNGDITVAAGTTLEIESGVTVTFAAGRGLTVNGQLLAEGTLSDGIVFTALNVSNYWSGLTINTTEGENESVVKYAAIKYGYRQQQSGGGVCIIKGTITLTNNTISN